MSQSQHCVLAFFMLVSKATKIIKINIDYSY